MLTPKLVIFDMDGLLFDTERLFMNKKHEILKEYGYPAREEDYIQTIGLAGKQLYDKMAEIYGPDYPGEEITKITRQRMKEHIDEFGPGLKPGILELLEEYKGKNIPCCVASSSHRDIVEYYLEKGKIRSYFQFILGGDDFARSKPEPDIFLAACEKENVAPQDALVYEDSDNGVLAAKNAGIPVICIPDLKPLREDLVDVPIAILSF